MAVVIVGSATLSAIDACAPGLWLAACVCTAAWNLCPLIPSELWEGPGTQQADRIDPVLFGSFRTVQDDD